jgi:hypothetical protein
MDTDTDSDTQLEAPRANQMARRTFDGIQLAGENAATQALVAKATADIQARWVMAMRRPRDMDEVRQMIIKECRRKDFAQTAIYAVPRGGNTIRGLSIRFAEVAMRCMGNMSCEAQTIYDSDEERIVRVIATDFESNATWPRDITIKKTVEVKQLKKGQRAIRDRINSYGDRVYLVDATDDQVATKEAAMISKAARTAILRLIPGHIQDEAFDLCDELMKKKDAENPDAARNTLFDAFASLNVMPTQIAEWLGHPVDQATPAELAELRKLYGALREGETSWAEAMEGAEEARARARKAAADRAGPKAAAGVPAAPPAAAATAEAPRSSATPPAAAAPPPPKAQTPAKGGKATAALKDQIKNDKPAEHGGERDHRAAPPAQPPKLEVVKPDPASLPMSHPDAEPPPESSPPPAGMEERKCAGCGVAIDVEVGAPAGALCYSCRSV